MVSNGNTDPKMQSKIQYFLRILSQFLEPKNENKSQESILHQLPPPPTITEPINTSKPPIPDLDKIQQKIEKRLNYKTDDNNLLFNSKLAHNRQVDQYRQKMKTRMINDRRSKKMEIMTFEKLEKKDQENADFLNIEDPLGRECLKLSNKFRLENGKSELKWEP